MINKESVVRKIARRVRDRYQLTPPVSFLNVLNQKSIILKYENLGTNGDGYSNLINDKLEIVVNSEIRYDQRIRFTIAHELGHIFINWHNDITICQTDNEYESHNRLDIQEKEANIFASELLLPTKWVKEQLENYRHLGLDEIIRILSDLSKTSIMACLYALGNALESGNAIIVSYPSSIFDKKFISERTCEIYLRDIDYEDSLDFFCINSNHFTIGYYTIKHYQFYPCPNKKEVETTYFRTGKDIEETLIQISDYNIINILHCLKSIICFLPDKYILKLYHSGKSLLHVDNCTTQLSLEYSISYQALKNQCLEYMFENGDIHLNNNLVLVWIKEPYFTDPEHWRASSLDSKQLLKVILKEIYTGEEVIEKLRSINGIIGSANTKKNLSREELYNVIQIKLRRDGLLDFVQHPQFDMFVSLRAYEIVRRRKS